MEIAQERVRVGFRIRRDLFEVLRKVAHNERLSQQDVIDRALEYYFEDFGPGCDEHEDVSFHELPNLLAKEICELSGVNEELLGPGQSSGYINDIIELLRNGAYMQPPIKKEDKKD